MMNLPIENAKLNFIDLGSMLPMQNYSFLVVMHNFFKLKISAVKKFVSYYDNFRNVNIDP